MPNEQMSTLTAGGVTYEIVDKVARAGGPQAKIVFLHQDDSECDTPAYGFGSCTVIHNDNTCIVYDFGADTSKRLLEYLVDNQIKKVDTVIASHYHEDHCYLASVAAFISGCESNSIDLSDCTFYLPHAGLDWSKYTGSSKTGLMANETNVINKLSEEGIPYVRPTVEGYSINSGDIHIEFFNVDSTLYESEDNNYYTWMYNEYNVPGTNTNYNNFSMCALLTMGRHKLLLTGDIMHPAQEQMAHLPKQADCIMVPHHGLNCREAKAFIDNMNCRYGVVPTFWSNKVNVIDEGLRPITARCRELGTVLCTLDEDIVFTIDEEGFRLTNETTREVKGRPSGQKLYRGEDLDTIDLGTFYVDNATEAATILHWPVVDGTRYLTGKVECIANGGATGRMQIMQETYSGKMRNAIRFIDAGPWSSWRESTLIQEMNPLMLSQRKNLMRNINATLFGTRTINGVTFTVSSDGTVTANGTATAVAEYYLSSRTLHCTYIPKGNYILSGCPSGGGDSTYRIGINRGDSGATVGNDTGNGFSFTENEGAYYGSWIRIANGYTADNIVFRPMIRPAFLNDEYVPYGASNSELSYTTKYALTYEQNDYVTEPSVSGISIIRYGKNGILQFNCNVDTPIPAPSEQEAELYKIGSFSGIDLLLETNDIVAAQDGDSAPLNVVLGSTGNLYVRNYAVNEKTSSGRYRATIPVLFTY